MGILGFGFFSDGGEGFSFNTIDNLLKFEILNDCQFKITLQSVVILSITDCILSDLFHCHIELFTS